ncbi:unnamed protein product [Thlaspi arvense]|uniref:Uncharacterized protein n=1 Tax=Thlaspi arvense TaxID=13288 RepID=A0AAU9TA00_THLAR|nr:unnamed protein product [Thlaspi arvense]
MSEERKKSETRVESEGTIEEVIAERNSTKEQKKKKKKNRENKDGEIAAHEGEKLGEEDLVKKKSEKRSFNSESEDDSGKKSKKRNKEKRADPEAGDDGVKKSKESRVDFEADDDGEKKSKKKNKEKRVDLEAEDDVKKSKKKNKKSKKESGGDVIGNSEGNRSGEDALVNTDDAKRETGKRKRDDSDLAAEENTDESNKEMKRKSKKKKPNVGSEVEENSMSSAEDAKKKSKKKKQSDDQEAEENSLSSAEDAEAIRKKKKPSEDQDVEENNNDSAKDAEAEGNVVNSTKDAKKKGKVKKKKQSADTEAVENSNNDGTKDAKKKKPSEDSEAEENNNDSTKDGKKKRKKQQKGKKSDEDAATPSSKSSKKVKFSDQVEVFPAEDEESEEEGGEVEEVELVRGKRFTEEEDELIKKSVQEYIDNHALGDEGVKMIMECGSHPEVKGCWKEIAAALPWRPYVGVYNRAHTLFEAGSKGIWTQEDFDFLVEYVKKHGNDWKAIGDAMGKSRKHVKDAWRRIRLSVKKKGHWSREEYQTLFDLVNKDIRMKAFQEKRAKHGMLRDNIPWMAISDKLRTRDHTLCCNKWYDQLQSPMVAKGIWANVDDYRLIDELTNLDAACVDDVDWDDLLDNRDGDICRKRWNQMVHNIGLPGSKTFAEQVEILSKRYCPELAEDREDFDNRPFDPED